MAESDEALRKKLKCHNYSIDTSLKGCKWGDLNAVPEYALVGDSHAESLVFELSEYFQRNQISFVQYTKDACPSMHLKTKTHRQPSQQCEEFSNKVYEEIKKNNIKNIILYSRWRWYVDGIGVNNGSGGVDSKDGIVSATNSSSERSVFDAFENTIHDYLGLGRVFLIYDTPEYGWSVLNRVLTQNARNDQSLSSNISSSIVAQQLSFVKNRFDSVQSSRNILIRVYPQSIFCDNLIQEVCIGEVDKKPLFLDSNHLSNLGAKILIENGLNVTK
jgi:hypothetical protein